MTIEIDQQLEWLRKQLYHLNMSEQGYQALVNQSWDYANKNNLFVSSEDDSERLFCLKRKTYGERALFLRIKRLNKNNDIWQGVRTLFTSKEERHPLHDKDPWNDALFTTFTDLKVRMDDLFAVIDESWQPPKKEIKGPEGIDKDEITSLINHEYEIYNRRPYLPEVFGFDDDIWKNCIVDYICSTYEDQHKNGNVYEIDEEMYMIDTGLTNANREFMYLIIQPSEPRYTLVTARTCRENFQGMQDRITFFTKKSHTPKKDYPLLTKWALISESDCERKLYPYLLFETWCYSSNSQTPELASKAIFKYLCNTFTRLLWEHKVYIFTSNKCRAKTLQDSEWAIFNTGLVDTVFREIYVVFRRKNSSKKCNWEFYTFDEKSSLSTYLPDFPKRAEYFMGDNKRFMFYDFSVENAEHPDVQTEHILIDNFKRLPTDVKNKYLGKAKKEYQKLLESDDDPKDLLNSRRTAKTHLISCFNNALKKAILRAKWNYRTGVPMYYIREGTTTILLPLALAEEVQNDWDTDTVSMPQCDLALVMDCVNENGKDKYKAKTILPLYAAYGNARLVNRPDSDWLTPEEVEAITLDDEDCDDD